MSGLSTIGALGSMGYNAGGIYSTLHLIDQPFFESLARVNKGLAVMTLEFQKQMALQRASLQQMQRTFLATGAMAALGVGLAVQQYRELDKEMRNVNTIAKVSEGELRNLTTAVKNMSREFGAFSPKQVAQGLYEIYSSGFKGAEALKLLHTSSRLAMGGLANFEQTTQAVVGTMNAYGKGTYDATQVSDIFFQTVNYGIIKMEDLTQGIGQINAVAAAARIPLEEVGGMIASMTAAGFMPENALVRVQRFISAITAKPSKELMELINKLGFDSGSKWFQEKGTAGVIEDLVKNVGYNNTAVLKTMFPDEREYQGALALMRDLGQATKGYIKDVSDYKNATARAVLEQQKSLDYQLNVLQQKWNVAIINFGEKFVPLVKDMTNWVSNFSGVLDDLNVKWVANIASVGLTVAGYLALISVFGKLKDASKFVAEGFLGRYNQSMISQMGGADNRNYLQQYGALKNELEINRMLAQSEIELGKVMLQKIDLDAKEAQAVLAKTEVLENETQHIMYKNDLASQELAQQQARLKSINQEITADSKLISQKSALTNAERRGIEEQLKNNILIRDGLVLRIKELEAIGATSTALSKETQEEIKNAEATLAKVESDRKAALALIAKNNPILQNLLLQKEQIELTIANIEKMVQEKGAIDAETEALLRNARAQQTHINSQIDAQLQVTTTTSKLKAFAAMLGLSWSTLAFFAGMALMGFVVDKVGKALSGTSEKLDDFKKDLEETQTAIQGTIDKDKELGSKIVELTDQYVELKESGDKSITTHKQMQTIATTLQGVTGNLTGAFKEQDGTLVVLTDKVYKYANGLINATDKMRDYIKISNLLEMNKLQDQIRKSVGGWGLSDSPLGDVRVAYQAQIKDILMQYSSGNIPLIDVQKRLAKMLDLNPNLSYGPKSLQENETAKALGVDKIMANLYNFRSTYNKYGPEVADLYTKTPSSALEKQYISNLLRDFSNDNNFIGQAEQMSNLKAFIEQAKRKMEKLNGTDRVKAAQLIIQLENLYMRQDQIDAISTVTKPLGGGGKTPPFNTSVGSDKDPYKKQNEEINNILTVAKDKIETQKRLGNLQDAIDTYENALEKIEPWLKGLPKSESGYSNRNQFANEYQSFLSSTNLDTLLGPRQVSKIEDRMKTWDERLNKSKYEGVLTTESIELMKEENKWRAFTIESLKMRVQALRDKQATYNPNSENFKLAGDRIDILTGLISSLDNNAQGDIKSITDFRDKQKQASIRGAMDFIKLQKDLYKPGENLFQQLDIIGNSVYVDDVELKDQVEDTINSMLKAEIKYLKEEGPSAINKILALSDVKGISKETEQEIIDTVTTLEGTLLKGIKESAETIDPFDVNKVIKNIVLEGTKSMYKDRYNILKEQFEAQDINEETYIERLRSLIELMKGNPLLKSLMSEGDFAALIKPLEREVRTFDKKVFENNVKAFQEYIEAINDINSALSNATRDFELTQLKLKLEGSLSENDINLITKTQELDNINTDINKYLQRAMETNDPVEREKANTESIKLQTRRLELQKEIEDLSVGTQFGKKLWDAMRDGDSFTDYMDTLINEYGYRAFNNFFKSVMEKPINDFFQKEVRNPDGTIMQNDGIFWKFAKDKLGPNAEKKIGGAASMYSGISSLSNINTTNPIAGGIQGGLGALSTAVGLESLLGASFGGPVMIAAALLGTVFGFTSAKKQKEKEQEQREKQTLKTLQNIDNKLAPVSDYYRRGGYEQITNTQNYGLGLDMALRKGVRI